MSTDLVPFDYEGQQVRVVRVDDLDPWFVAADVARVLGYSATSAMTRSLDDLDKGVHSLHTPGGEQDMTIISESGLYIAIFGSRVPGAQQFKQWLAHEVLPAIRKTGAYGRAIQLPSKAELAQWVIDAEARADRETAARIEAEAHAKELEAPASAWQHMASSTGDYLVGDAAKILSRDPSITIGRDRLFAFMSAQGWIYRSKSTRRGWRAYQTQVECGRLVEKMASPFLNQKTGEMELPDPTIRVTAKGLAELHKRLGGSDPVATLAVAA